MSARSVEGQYAGLRLVDEDQGQDPDEQEGRAGEGVEEELHRRVAAALVAPAGDDEVDRHEGELEERRRTGSGRARRSCRCSAASSSSIHADEGPRVAPRCLADATRAIGKQQRRHQHQEERDAVDARGASEIPSDRDPLMGGSTNWKLPSPVLNGDRRPPAREAEHRRWLATSATACTTSRCEPRDERRRRAPPPRAAGRGR